MEHYVIEISKSQDFTQGCEYVTSIEHDFEYYSETYIEEGLMFAEIESAKCVAMELGKRNSKLYFRIVGFTKTIY